MAENSTNLIKYEYKNIYVELAQFIQLCIPLNAFKEKRVKVEGKEGEANCDIQFQLTNDESTEYYVNFKKTRQNLYQFIKERHQQHYSDTYKITKEDVCAYIDIINEGVGFKNEEEYKEYLEKYIDEITDEEIKDYYQKLEMQEFQLIIEQWEKNNPNAQ